MVFLYDENKIRGRGPDLELTKICLSFFHNFRGNVLLPGFDLKVKVGRKNKKTS